jgi:hypothetical protein
MKKNLSLIFFCFLAGLFGANVTPILTGAGKLIFPETSPSASLSASSGQLTVAAGGSSQHVLLLPSSGGAVGVNTTDPSFTNTLGHNPGLGVVSTSTPILAGYSPTQPAFALNVDPTGYWLMYDHAAAAWSMGIVQTGGRVGVGVAPGAANQLDVGGGGWVNATNGYKTNGATGYNYVLGVRNSANTGTCTMTFNGGILVNLSGC